jgi:hypothetical protein
VIAALAVVFGWLLPRFIDYQQVWAALTELDAWEVVVLLGLALARIPTEALMYRAFLPGLRLWRGTEAYLSSNVAAQVLPPPAPSVVQYGYFRGGGYAPDAAALAALGSFLFPTIGRFLLPVVAIMLLLITGEVNGSILLAGEISLVVTAVAGIGGYCFLRGERSARRLGAKLQRPLSWILMKFKRDPIEDGAGRAAQLRANTLTVLREGLPGRRHVHERRHSLDAAPARRGAELHASGAAVVRADLGTRSAQRPQHAQRLALGAGPRGVSARERMDPRCRGPRAP